MKIKKGKIVSGILIFIMIFTFTACGLEQAEDVSLYDLNKAMSQVADFGEMKYASATDSNSEELFEKISSMDYSKVNGFFINYAANGTGNADEIACIQVKNKTDINEAVASLNAHLKKRIALYETYDKSQNEKLSRAAVSSYGNIAILIVGDKVNEMQRAFNQFLGE